jgi:GNAT superfamily N-acetyltransferase
MPTTCATTIADMDHLLDLAARLGAEDGGQSGEAVTTNWAHESGRESFTRALETLTSCILVAEVDDRLVGTLHGYLRPANSWRTVPIAEIVTLFVEPGSRNQRLGEALVSQFRSWAAGEGRNASPSRPSRPTTARSASISASAFIPMNWSSNKTCKCDAVGLAGPLRPFLRRRH